MPRDPTRLSMTGTRKGSLTAKREQKMNMFNRRFSTVTCLGFTILQFLLCACKAEAGEILIAPQTQHLLLGVDQTANFFCQAVGINAYWLIDGDTVPALGNNDWKGKGWMFNEIVDPDTTGERRNIHNMTLQIPSNTDFNNTRIQCLGVIHDPAVSDPVFLIIKAIFLSIESSSVYAPAIYYITQNRTDRTMFYCSISGNHAFWGINGTTVSDGGGDAWTDSGFTFDSRIIDQDQMGNQHILQNTLGVPALMEYNNTVIFCAVLVGSGHQPVQSNSVKIVVMGAPSSPVPVLTFDRPGEVTLEWNTPFSWPQYPVHSYDVMVPNHSRENINETRVKFSAGEDQHNCEPITFKVRATSELGKSEYGSVIAGFPIEPQLMDNSIGSIQISQQENGKPQVSMKIKLPRVCSYQSTNYNITIAEKGSDKLTTPSITSGPFNGNVRSDSVLLMEGLQLGKSYRITVKFITEVRQEPLEVFKDIYIMPPVTPNVGSFQDSSESTQYIIIGSAVGGLLLLITVLMVVVITIRVVYKHQHMRSWSPSQNGKRPMVTNPIYDGGPVYETIPPGAPLRLHSNSESSNITATSSMPPTPTSPLPPVPLPTESPYAYAPNQVDPTYAQPHQHAHVNISFEEQSYMIMSTVQNAMTGKRLSEGEETTLDGDSNSARYVPEPRQPYGSASMV